MPVPDVALLAHAARHHGLFRAEDARRLGLSRRQVDRRVAAGRFERLGAGVYRVAGAAPTRHQRLLSAVWRSRGVASHRSAAELHGVWSATDHLPEVTVARTGAHELPDALVHRSADLDRTSVVRRWAIPCTPVPRTIVDLGAVVGERQVENVLHAACRQRLTTVDAVASEYRRVSRRGRHGAGAIGSVLRALGALEGTAESDLEVLLLRILREHGLPEPVLQHWVEVGGHRFRVDVCYPGHRLFIEGDGFGVHGTRSAFEADRWRQNLLVVAGWRPLRFTWRQLRHRPGEVAAQVRQALAVPA